MVIRLSITVKLCLQKNVIIWIGENQLARRNLNTYQRVTLQLVLEELYAQKGEELKDKGRSLGGKTAGRGRQKNSSDHICDQSYKDDRYLANEEIAKKAETSHNTMARTKKIETIAPPVIKEKARSGEVSINQVYKDVQQQERKKRLPKN